MTIEINALLLFSMRIQHFFDSKIVCAWRVAAQMLAFIWCFKLHNFNMNLKQFLLNPNWFFFSSQSFFRAQLLMLLLCCVCVCLVKPSTICHRCEHEYFDYYCDYFVWCVLGTKIQMESHIIDLTHRCVNSRCNVTHFKWCVCVFFFFLLCLS